MFSNMPVLSQMHLDRARFEGRPCSPRTISGLVSVRYIFVAALILTPSCESHFDKPYYELRQPDQVANSCFPPNVLPTGRNAGHVLFLSSSILNVYTRGNIPKDTLAGTVYSRHGPED